MDEGACSKRSRTWATSLGRTRTPSRTPASAETGPPVHLDVMWRSRRHNRRRDQRPIENQAAPRGPTAIMATCRSPSPGRSAIPPGRARSIVVHHHGDRWTPAARTGWERVPAPDVLDIGTIRPWILTARDAHTTPCTGLRMRGVVRKTATNSRRFLRHPRPAAALRGHGARAENGSGRLDQPPASRCSTPRPG